jgi:hypothetical protein
MKLIAMILGSLFFHGAFVQAATWNYIGQYETNEKTGYSLDVNNSGDFIFTYSKSWGRPCLVRLIGGTDFVPKATVLVGEPGFFRCKEIALNETSDQIFVSQLPSKYLYGDEILQSFSISSGKRLWRASGQWEYGNLHFDAPSNQIVTSNAYALVFNDAKTGSENRIFSFVEQPFGFEWNFRLHHGKQNLVSLVSGQQQELFYLADLESQTQFPKLISKPNVKNSDIEFSSLSPDTKYFARSFDTNVSTTKVYLWPSLVEVFSITDNTLEPIDLTNEHIIFMVYNGVHKPRTVVVYELSTGNKVLEIPTSYSGRIKVSEDGKNILVQSQDANDQSRSLFRLYRFQ